MNGAGLESVEDKVRKAVSKFHLDQQGCSPSELRVYAQDDIVVVYSSGIYTATERKLSQTEDGRKLIKSSRRELRSLTRRMVEREVAAILSRRVLRSFWDLDVRTGEQVEVYMLGELLPL